MGKTKHLVKNQMMTDYVNKSKTRLTQAEISDRSGEIPELDLHGERANEASIEIYNYLSNMSAAGEPCCRIVHGKGAGVLEQLVIEEIEDFAYRGLIEISFASRKYPGAAIIVVFHV